MPRIIGVKKNNQSKKFSRPYLKNNILTLYNSKPNGKMILDKAIGIHSRFTKQPKYLDFSSK